MGVVANTVQRIMDVDAIWTVDNSGKISAKMTVSKNPEFPELPRFGLRLFVPSGVKQVTYRFDETDFVYTMSLIINA